MDDINEVLFSNRDVIIQYDPVQCLVTCNRKCGMSPLNIALSSSLKHVCYFPDTGDLIANTTHGDCRIYLSKSQLLIDIMLKPEENITVINGGFILAEGGDKPRAWRISEKKLIPLVFEQVFINREFLPHDRFTLLKTKDGCMRLVTADREVQINKSERLLLPRIQREIRKPEKIDAESYPELTLLVKNATNRSMIKFSKTDSYFAFFSVENGEEKLIQVVDKHACALRQIKYFSDCSFISLDSGGKMKIWVIDEIDLHVCQTISPDEFHKNSFYNDFDLDLSQKQLLLRTNERVDYYRVDISKYKKQHKNNLILFQHSEDIDQKQAGNDVNTKEASTDKRLTSDSRGRRNKVCPTAPDAVIYGSMYLKKGFPESYSGGTYPAASGTGREQSGVDSFIIPSEEESGAQDLQVTNPDHSEKPSHEEAKAKNLNPGSRFRRQQATIYVGIDFGTSRTKVSFNNESEGRYEPLSFKHLQPTGYQSIDLIDEYAIPSLVRHNKEQLQYGYNALIGQGELHTYFKQKLLNEAKPDYFTQQICAGFLAYIMKIAKDQILSLTNAKMDDKFVFSVCLPVERMNRSTVARRFESILKHAKRLMENDSFNSLPGLAASAFFPDSDNVRDDNTRTAIVPESIAEVLDFCNRKARNKLYALYDFGAGTTDLTIFYYNTSKGQAEIIEAQVLNRGYSYIDKLKKNGEVDPAIIKNYYHHIWEEIKNGDIWRRVKRRIVGDESMRVFYDITLFGSGGGFNDQIVRVIFNRIPLFHEKTKEFIEAKQGISKLEEPIEWDAAKPPYFRYAVSFGLTKKPEETEKTYVLPRDCPVRNSSVKIRTSREPDVLYPSADWLGRR